MIKYEEMIEHMMSLGFKKTETFSYYCGFRKDPFYVTITQLTSREEPFWEFMATMNVKKDGWYIPPEPQNELNEPGMIRIKQIATEEPHVEAGYTRETSEILEVTRALAHPQEFMATVLNIEWAVPLAEAWLKGTTK